LIKWIFQIEAQTLTFHTTLAQHMQANIALDSLQCMVQAHTPHTENDHLGTEQPLALSCQASEVEVYETVMNEKVVDKICQLSMELSMLV
jgi:hypothetical protein